MPVGYPQTMPPCPPDELIEFAGVALRENDPDRVLRRAVELVAEGLGIEHVEVIERVPGSEALVVRACCGRLRETGPRELVRNGVESQAGYTLRVREPVVVPELADERRFTDERLLRRGVVSSVSVAVDGNGAVPEAVLLAAVKQRRTFSRDELYCLVVLADVVAGALRRIRTEAELRAAEGRYRKLIESLPIVTYVDHLDAKSSSVYASPQIEALTGYKVEEWSADPDKFVELLHPDDRERVLVEHARLREPGDRLSTQYRLLARDDRVVWVNDRAEVVRDGATGAVHLQGVMMDVTEEKRLAEQLARAQRLEAIGRLAGGVAHDFNNLLTGIVGYAGLALQSLPEGHPVREDVGEIAAAGQRAADLTRQLLLFSRDQPLEPRVLDLNELISELLRMLGRVIGDDVTVTTTLAPGLGRVRADAGQLEQVVMNLAVNARDAMPDGGSIAIETANVELGDEYAHRRLVPAAPGSYVMLAVADTGEGMDAATLEQIFEPFFTTKPPGEGTGLGLSTVYGIVKQSGGFVWPYSEPGRGSIFRVYLPRVDEPAESHPHIAAVQGGDEAILLLEDDEFVRTVIARDLRGLGYDVVAAADAEHALELVHAGQPVDLLLADVAMPGVDGVAVGRRLQEEIPCLRVLYMSGYAAAATAAGAPASALIEKPFGATLLAQRVRAALDEPPVGAE